MTAISAVVSRSIGARMKCSALRRSGSMALELAIPPSKIDWDQLDAPSGGGVVVPNLNWIAQAGIPTLGLSSQDFFSLVPASDVRIGDTLAGFSFISRHRPGNIDYYIEYGSRSETESGFTIGPVYTPVSVPDSVANTFGLLALAFAGLAGLRRIQGAPGSALLA